MKEQPNNKPTPSENTDTHASVDVEDRRAAARRAFIAEALVVEINSGARLSGRCCDLVAHGCYMDTLNPFQQGTLVRIRLQHGNETAEAKGKIVYRVPNLGMGIAFSELTAENQATLSKWLSQAGDESRVFDAALPPIPSERAPLPQQREGQVVKLIQLLLSKGILSKIEAAVLLDETIE